MVQNIKYTSLALSLVWDSLRMRDAATADSVSSGGKTKTHPNQRRTAAPCWSPVRVATENLVFLTRCIYSFVFPCKYSRLQYFISLEKYLMQAFTEENL